MCASEFRGSAKAGSTAKADQSKNQPAEQPETANPTQTNPSHNAPKYVEQTSNLKPITGKQVTRKQVNSSLSKQADSSSQQLPFFELSSDIMCVLDEQGCCLKINPAFFSHLGYSQAQMQTRSLASLAHPDDRKMHEEAIARSLTNPTQAKLTCRYQHQSGGYRWLSWSLAIVSTVTIQTPNAQPNTQPNTQQLYCVARDVTAEKQNHQKQLAVAQAKYQERYQERCDEFQRSTEQTRHKFKQVRQEAQMYADAVQNMQIGLYIWHLEEKDTEENSTDEKATEEKGTKGKPLEETEKREPENNKRQNTAETLRLVASNPAAQEATGVDAISFVGKTIKEIFPALATTDIPQTYIDVIRSGQNCDLGEIAYGDQNVKPSTFTVKAFPLSGQCVGITFENITQRRQYEQAHQAQEEQLRIIFNQAGIGMARVSPTGQWIQVNQKLCSLLEYSKTELLEKTFSEVGPPEEATADQKCFQQLISGEHDQLTFEKRYITKNGHTIWALVTLSVVREAAETAAEALYFIATIQNITERKQNALSLQSQKNDLIAVNVMLTSTMSQLKERNHELDQFAYVTSHDLRAPLRAINNLAGWIEEDIGDRLPDENKAQFGLLKSRVARMEGLINGLLEYARVARTHQSHEQVNITQLVTNVFDALSPPAGFKLSLSPQLPTLEAKKAPLTQIFFNLINNAITHHHRTEGIVQVSARELDSFYEFAVTDDGPGIEAIYHEKIFVIFQTLQSRDELESTGIGLSLVKKIVSAEGGTVSVESKPGEGSTFKVTWPKSPNQGVSLT
ncbi:MAG: PAS domain S-box protein [Cyanobacteria bacterium J06650_10]